MNTSLILTEEPIESDSASNSALPFLNNRILHIKLWYANGKQGEMNLTSPWHDGGWDVEVQYSYMRMYLRKMAPEHGIIAYQASIIYADPERGLRPAATWDKVDCTKIPPLKPGQFCEHD